MDFFYITEILIESVRHLKNIKIPLHEEKIKHLILTGKNGSGKTSVLDAIAQFLNSVSTTDIIGSGEENLQVCIKELNRQKENGESQNEILKTQKRIQYWQEKISLAKQEVEIKFNYSSDEIQALFETEQFILAYYKSDRVFHAENPKHVEKVELRGDYKITETPRENFVKYLLDLKMTEALAISNGKKEKANLIKTWFEKFESLLKKIFKDSSIRLEFDEDTFLFYICENGKEKFDFNTLSSGYAAILDIVADIIIRMEKKTGKTFQFYMPGIVLIDEIETHLHLELQKRVLDLLTTIFPNIQFILSTHSPFILNSLKDTVIYDLENNILVENGLIDIPYEGIVEGYFNVDVMSEQLKQKYERYKELIKKKSLSDEDFEEIAKLELFLDEIPDYLALKITTEYQRLKMEFENREDI